MTGPEPLPSTDCERCGKRAETPCYMPRLRCPRPGPQRPVPPRTESAAEKDEPMDEGDA